eukprot:1157588-Pelagomonas_calceolata.AAC.11
MPPLKPYVPKFERRLRKLPAARIEMLAPVKAALHYKVICSLALHYTAFEQCHFCQGLSCPHGAFYSFVVHAMKAAPNMIGFWVPFLQATH